MLHSSINMRKPHMVMLSILKVFIQGCFDMTEDYILGIFLGMEKRLISIQ